MTACACPQEDSGGPGGYENMLAAANDKKHPDCAEWLGQFDPEAFSAAEVNAELRAVR